MSNHKHLFPIINAMVDKAVKEVVEDGEEVTCRAGCTHCCHLLIEISKEEADELVEWTMKQPQAEQDKVIARIKNAAQVARDIFDRRKESKIFKEPIYNKEIEIPDDTFDEYFYEKKRPCPFLDPDDNKCVAYESRPTPCRLHLVTSDPALCAYDIGDEEDYEVHEALEELKDEAAPAIEAVELDGRWGQLAIMVEAMMLEQGIIEPEKPGPIVITTDLSDEAAA